MAVSLLDSTNADVVVYLSETWIDSDGNTMLRPSATGITTRARIQPAPQSGTSSRRAEQMDKGYFTEQVYALRFPRGFPHVLDHAAEIDWNGQRWHVFGFPLLYQGSRRTRRYDYVIRRN